MRATLLTLTRVSSFCLVAARGGSLSAQQPNQPAIPAVSLGTQPRPGAPIPPPAVPPLSLPTNIPKPLVTVQQLAFAAYPKLRTRDH